MRQEDDGIAKKLIIIGAGGHAKVVADIALAVGYEILGFLDDRATTAPLPGYEILGPVEKASELNNSRVAFLIAIGDNQTRLDIATKLSKVFPDFVTLIHPHAIISPYAEIGYGTVIMPGVIVNAGATIGNHVILNTSCTVDHDCWVEAYAHLSPGVHLAGNVTIYEGAHLGTGACVIPGKSVGAWAVVGAGAVVTEDIPNRVTAVGVPARVVSQNSPPGCNPAVG